MWQGMGTRQIEEEEKLDEDQKKLDEDQANIKMKKDTPSLK